MILERFRSLLEPYSISFSRNRHFYDFIPKSLRNGVLRYKKQLARPEWSCFADYDPPKAIDTRWDFYAKYVDKPVLVIGTHFSPPTAGYIVADGERYKLKC